MTFDNRLVPQIEAMIETLPTPKTEQEKSQLVELVLPFLLKGDTPLKTFILHRMIEHWGIQIPPDWEQCLDNQEPRA